MPNYTPLTLFEKSVMSINAAVKAKLAEADIFPTLLTADAYGNRVRQLAAFHLGKAYGGLALQMAQQALTLRAGFVVKPGVLNDLAAQCDFRMPPGLAGGGLPLFRESNLVGAVGILATTGTGRAPEGRVVRDVVKDVLAEHGFGGR